MAKATGGYGNDDRRGLHLMKSELSDQPSLSVIVATYNRADYLQICLACLAAQDYEGWWQVIVADDGSTDHTADVISHVRSHYRGIQIQHCWHEHKNYRRAFILNEGSRMASGDVLIFLDSDCVPAPNLLSTYAAHTQPNSFYLGGVYHVTQQFAETILASGQSFSPNIFWTQAIRRENQKKRSAAKVLKRYWKSRFYTAVKYRKPKVWGGNFAVNRDVFEEVNGYDENYIGYGQEDSDLRNRLVKGSYRAVSLHIISCVYHLWHPPAIEARRRPNGRMEFNNRKYYRRSNLEVVCKNGLRKL